MKEALWSSIAATLTAEIGAGHYRPGDRLPTEAALAARFGVNRHTVRHALAALADRGLVHSRRGAGVFVAQRPTDYPLGAGCGSTRTFLRRSDPIAADQPDRDPALRCRRARSLRLKTGRRPCGRGGLAGRRAAHRGLPVVFPAARFPDLLAEVSGTGSITRALAALGPDRLYPGRDAADRAAGRPGAGCGAGRAAGAPVLRTVAVNVDPKGAPVELGTTWLRGERVTLTVANQP